MSSRIPIALLTLAAGVVGIGCVSAENKYNDFAGRVVDAAPLIDGGGVLADISGEHLWVLVTIISPPQPLYFRSTVTNYQEVGDGTASADFSFQPLKFADLAPTGDPLVANGTGLRANGAFQISFTNISVPADANPITQQPITATLVIDGAIQSPDLWCGTVDGEANMLALFGSTFAGSRIALGTAAADLPIDTAPGACPP